MNKNQKMVIGLAAVLILARIAGAFYFTHKYGTPDLFLVRLQDGIAYYGMVIVLAMIAYFVAKDRPKP